VTTPKSHTNTKMNPIEIKIVALKGFDIRNEVGGVPTVRLDILDVDGSIGKKISESVHSLIHKDAPKTPEELVKKYKKTCNIPN
jgi:hypothetical protein